MIDTNFIKDNPKLVSDKLRLRNYNFNLGLFEATEANRKKYQTKTEAKFKNYTSRISKQTKMQNAYKHSQG